MPAQRIQTILEIDVKAEAADGRVSGGKAVETSDGFLLLFIVAGRERYLATRREPDKPRAFRNFERLTALYRAIYPDGAELFQFQHREPFTFSKSRLPAVRKKAKAKAKAKKNKGRR